MEYIETGSGGIICGGDELSDIQIYGMAGAAVGGAAFDYIGVGISGGIICGGDVSTVKEFVEKSRGDILPGGDCIDQLLMRTEIGSGGAESNSSAQVWVVRATDIKESNIGLAMVNYNILKAQELINETSKPNKKKIMNSRFNIDTAKKPFDYPNDNGWCSFDEHCNSEKKAFLPVITQRNMNGALPPKN